MNALSMETPEDQPVRAYKVIAYPVGLPLHLETIVYGTTRKQADEAANKWLRGGDMDKVMKVIHMEEIMQRSPGP